MNTANNFWHSSQAQLGLRILLGLIAAFGALLIGEHVYLKEYLTTDENSYLFQAWLFSQGEMRLECPPLREAFFHQMLICDDQAGWLSRYPPAQAVWLIPGVLVGYPRLMTAVAVFIAVWFLSKAGERLKIPIWITIGLLFLSPYFWLLQGSVLSHTSAFAATALMMWSYLVWRQEHKYRYAAIAGLAWAFLFLDRTYTAFWIALPFAIDSIAHLLKSKSRQEIVSTLIFSGCAALGGVILLAYNAAATGDPFLSTYLYYDPSDDIGFGNRHGYDHTIERGWGFIRDNISELNSKLWGFKGSLVVWLGLALYGYRRHVSGSMILATLLVWLSYVAFWFEGIVELAPVYYYETLVFIVLGAGLGMTKFININWHFPRWVALFSIGFIAIIVSTQALKTFNAEALKITIRNDYKAAFQNVIRGVPPGSIVILNHVYKSILSENSWNALGLDSDPLIVRETKGVRHALYHLYPNRPVYVINGHYPQPAQRIIPFDGKIPIYHAEKMGALTGKNISIEGDIKHVSEAPDKAGIVGYGYQQYYLPGTYEIRFFLDAIGQAGEVIGDVKVISRRIPKVLAEEFIHAGDQEILLTVKIDHVDIAEPKIYFSGKGRLVFDRIETKRLPDNNL